MLAALLLFAVFAVGVLSALLGGAGIYRRLTRRSQEGYDSRTGLQYLAARVRQAPDGDSVSVGSFGGVEVLRLRQEIDGREYVTWVYCQDGWLMELFGTGEGVFAPEDGERLIPMESLSLTLEEGLLTLCLTDSSGASQRLCLCLREVRP